MSQWRVLDLQRFEGSISAKDGHVYLGDQSVALADVATILTGPKCLLHASLIDRAAEFQVSILPCDWRGVPLTAIVPWSSNTRVATRHIAQASLSEPRRKNAWMRIVKAKIKGQGSNLPEESPARRRLAVLAGEVKSGDPANCEAQAARIYWGNLFQESDFTRNRTQEDNRNAHLNYGYTILRGLVVRNIVAAGLWPTLGIWHKSRSNTFALADDLIEPFRPAVDYLAKQLHPDTKLIDEGVRAHLVGVSDLKFGNQNFTLSTELEHLCQKYAQYVEGDVASLDVAHWAHG